MPKHECEQCGQDALPDEDLCADCITGHAPVRARAQDDTTLDLVDLYERAFARG